MAAPIKAVLVALLSAAALIILTHLALLSPFYMTAIVETFNLANVAANDNYVKQMYYDESFKKLKELPMFKKSWEWGGGGDGWTSGNIIIKVENAYPDTAHNKAVGNNNEFEYNWDGDRPSSRGVYKPYCQRGKPIKITIYAVYPFEVMLGGRPLRRELPVSFSITTIGLKYYKDLDYDYLYSG
jgi:hypothetical protein